MPSVRIFVKFIQECVLFYRQKQQAGETAGGVNEENSQGGNAVPSEDPTALFRLTSRLLPWYLRPVKSSDHTAQEEDNDHILQLTLKLNIEADLTDLITDIAILVAFGTLFPPIAVIGHSSITMRTGFIQFFFGR